MADLTIKSFIPKSKSRFNLFINYNDTYKEPLVKSSSQYQLTPSKDDIFNEAYWETMFPTAAYFHVYNNVLGDIFAMVYNNNHKSLSNHTLSSFIISKHGCSVYNSLDLSKQSIYYPAIENLPERYRTSKVRKALAVSLLKTFAKFDKLLIDSLYKQANLNGKVFDWDESQAGLLASEMRLLDARPPHDIGRFLYNLGYLTVNVSSSCYIVDVVYNEETNELTDRNNAMAFLLGKQLEQLFDPLSEYSPEPTEKVYKIPTNPEPINDNDLINSICDELISVQTNYTVLLVQFLRNFIIPLRVKVLEGKIPGITTNQINRIFPPTIDEVTRINCIFLDMIKLARPYGSYEVLRACGETIPYFYKAQMRHEGAIKNFLAGYASIKDKLDESYDQRTIQTALYSSLNLVKIQLIVQRLYRNKEWPAKLAENVDLYLKSCDDTISSFANDQLKPYNGRIFTPTGKILTEIAENWPSSLQYGWLTRRVVAVFDVIDVLQDTVYDKAVIIVFSDHVLVLSIIDDEYYRTLWDSTTNIHKPNVSDILMHSLTNETPLNKLPRMRVTNWVSINDIYSIYYYHENRSFVRFFNVKDDLYTGVYQLDEGVSGKYVTEVLARSKVLNKSQSFHLFSGSENENLKRVYYIAHEKNGYNNEVMKSPFLILFNEKYTSTLMNKYPNVFTLITLNFVNDSVVRLEGETKCNDEDGYFSYEIEAEKLSESLTSIFSELFTMHMSIYNKDMIDYLIKNNGYLNKRVYKVVEVPFEKLESSRQEILNKKVIEVTKTRDSRPRSHELLNKQEQRKKSLFDIFKREKSNQRQSSVVHHVSLRKELKPTKPSKPSKTLKLPTPSETTNPTAPVEYKEEVEPVSVKNHIKRDSQMTAPLTVEGGESRASASIYVNSHFEFPMEAPKHAEIKEPMYAKLDGTKKRTYKDSVDIMGGMLQPGKERECVSYDDDLFELLKKPEPKLESLRVIETPTPPVECVAEPVRRIKPVGKSTFNKSDSFYFKFQHLRDEQERQLRRTGISQVRDVGFSLPAFNPGVCEEEGENWEIGEESVEDVSDVADTVHVGNDDNIQLMEEKKLGREEVSDVFGSPVSLGNPLSPFLDLEISRFDMSMGDDLAATSGDESHILDDGEFDYLAMIE